MFKKMAKKLAILTVAVLTLAASQITVFAADTQAPTAPQNLRITNRSGFDIQLSWDASTDNVGVNNYNLYAYVNNGTSSWREDVAYVSGSAERKYSIQMSDNRTYTFYVDAIDAAGNRSAPSNSFVFTVDTIAPSAPGNLRYTSLTSNTIYLKWDASTDNFSGIKNYSVWKDGVFVGNVSSSSTSAFLMGLLPQTTYTFEVRALDNSYDGNYSAPSTLTVTTP